ncbi:hypothetical protein AGABI2DRAFT_113948 [Agaricus bisporus var. bisporus H97]|uniref:hypothetical protein n=1 Tax=Agaricus bisporus var. bisporus (strain H97 / ATCC MYA-4626 / FGSC 10389) TaxID=936046 RepID=UPI00029F6A55|nr:hypothetical protein AGABI2DRAFT_113948 [Agaricus bisporus var. bisporus H97]EKV51212.1 hypothetical protein AGABI2DRAFT_113948 [Agaricus bisporus var. bisporus H97]
MSQADVPVHAWPLPKAPLPPHRLAKLANALGVAVPAASPDPCRRAPTPSAPPATSKFLLHVLPPLAFPSDPPPSSPSGYHTHFRRGILVPVHASFQSQLAAIAKEYALPSSVGLVLYLITQPSEEPGPLLSDDIWKHLWTRVLQVEHRDDSRPPTPGLLSLRTAPASRSTPHLPTSLRPFASTPTGETPPPVFNATSPSTPSSVSDPPSLSKSIPGSSQGDPETPDTSAASNAFGAQLKAQYLDLPGLHSPSLIPILAKVEFDIDRRKAVWYEPWLRSRKANHAKRAESRSTRRQSTHEEDAEDHARQPPIQLIISQQRTASPLSMFASPVDGGYTPIEQVEITGYQQLSDGEDPLDYQNNEECHTTFTREKDPLADVFGTDADTWADIRATVGRKRESDSGAVGLALTAADLSGLDDDDLQEPRSFEEEESNRSSSSMHTAKRHGHVPPPLVLPPKDAINDLVVPSESSPWPGSAGSVGLAYLNSDSSPKKSPLTGYSEGETSEELHDQYIRAQSSVELEKQADAFGDELEFGDSTEDFDENDPNDRRRSQFLFRAQLDEIERTMAQLSPRILKSELEGDNSLLSPRMPSSNSPLPSPGMLNADYYTSPSFRVSDDTNNIPALSHPDRVQGPPRTSSAGVTSTAWPAVPFSSIRESRVSGSSNGVDEPPSPPRLALNGVTTSAPRSFISTSSNAISAETERRKQELEEEYPALAKSSDPVSSSTADSPIVPLSPDPFARYPSSAPAESTIRGHNSNSSYQGTRGQGSRPLESVAEDETISGSLEKSRWSATSRFSADSITIIGDEGIPAVKPSMKASLMTVRSIKKLWRRSNHRSNPSNASINSSISGRGSPPVPPLRPERPSRETMDLPDVPVPKISTNLNISGRSSPQTPTRPERPSEETMDFPDVTVPTPPSNFRALSTERNQSLSLAPARVSQDHSRFPAPHTTLQDQYVPSQDRTNGPNGQNKVIPPHSKQGLQIPQTPILEGLSPSPSLPNPEGYPVPTSLSDHPESLMPGLQLPSYGGRKTNVSPIIPSQRLPEPGGSSMNKFHFDQESPYPIHKPSSPRYSPRPVSPPALRMQSRQASDVWQQSQGLPSPYSDKEKPVRRSILKTSQKSPKTPPLPLSNSPVPSESRANTDRMHLPSSSISRSRKPSFQSTRSFTTSNEIPPSPQIQNNSLLIGKNGLALSPDHDGQVSGGSGLMVSSIDSSPTSHRQNLGRQTSPSPDPITSSRSSVDSRPSFDASPFEIVSPKMTNPHIMNLTTTNE